MPVMMLPDGKLCIVDGRSKIPDNSFVFGSDSEYYDADGKILPAYKDLPRYKMTDEHSGKTSSTENR